MAPLLRNYSDLQAKILIKIDPACDLLYASYYLYALRKWPNAAWSFSDKPFRGLIPNQQYLALEVTVDGKVWKIVIDHSNREDIFTDAYNWCDRYGKVNMDLQDAGDKKIFPIGPLFAIRLYNRFETYFWLVLNVWKSWSRIKSVKRFVSAYRGQLKRLPFEVYEPGTLRRNYVFFAGSLWKKEDGYNRIRSTYMSVCKTIEQLHFEGGFAPRKLEQIHGFEENTLKERISLRTYLEKIKSSHFVFNNPSVRHCNGWRTGEVLALGKIILSVPIVRVMPGNFQPGIHYIETDGTADDLREKIVDIISHPTKYEGMGEAARVYFQQHLHPDAIIRKLIPEIVPQDFPSGGDPLITI